VVLLGIMTGVLLWIANSYRVQSVGLVTAAGQGITASIEKLAACHAGNASSS